MINQKKTDLASQVTSALKEHGNFAVVNFQKSTHKTLESLKKSLRTHNAFMSVVKNTIFEKAVNKLSQEEKDLQNVRKAFFPLKDKNILMTFKGDWAAGLKEFAKATKSDETFTFKFGKIDNTIYNSQDMLKLAELPSKPELVGKLLGAMMNPVSRTTRALSFSIQQFVYVLSQKAQK